jgi:hypothetical protein
MTSLAFALLAFMSAVVAVLPTVDRSQPVTDVTGSPPTQAQSGRVVGNVLGRGDFVTRASDGAHAAVHFARPLAFTRIEHRYATEPWPQYRVRGAAMQWSDDGRTWQDGAVARAEDGRFSFDVRDAGAHAHWRLLVLESGGDAQVVIGNLRFSRSVWAAIPVDLAWLGWGLALLGAIAALPGGLTRPRIFAVAAVSTGLFVLAYTLLFAPHWVMPSADSGGYVQPLVRGSYTAYRSAGYPTFLRLVHATVGVANLVPVQLALELLCFMIGLGMLARAYGLWIAGAGLALLAGSLGVFSAFAAQLLTEGLFVSGFTLAAAALAAAARRPATALLVAAGLGLAIATAAKAVGIVLIVPALALARFIPCESRRRAFAWIILLPVGIYAAMVAHGYRRTGGVTPEAAGGYALAGHVAGFLDGRVPDAPGLVEALQEAVRPVLAARPPDLDRIRSKQTLDAYVAATTGDYNTLLWETMVPVTTRYLGSRTGHAMLNRTLMRVAVAAVLAHPMDYARHVAAHYYGLWRYLGLGQAADLPGAAFSIRAALAELDDAQRASLAPYLEPALPPLPSPAVIRAAAALQASVPLAFRGLGLSFLGREEVTIGIGALALLLGGLVLVPGPLARAYAGEIMLALMLDAYALAQALFQVVLVRYAEALMPVSVLLVACVTATTLRLLRRALPDLRSYSTAYRGA